MMNNFPTQNDLTRDTIMIYKEVNHVVMQPLVLHEFWKLRCFGFWYCDLSWSLSCICFIQGKVTYFLYRLVFDRQDHFITSFRNTFFHISFFTFSHPYYIFISHFHHDVTKAQMPKDFWSLIYSEMNTTNKIFKYCNIYVFRHCIYSELSQNRPP